MDARARILVYGEPLVIDALAKFWDLGAGFDTPERQEAFVKVIQMMRLASGHGEMSAQTVKSVLLENVDVIRERKAGRTFR